MKKIFFSVTNDIIADQRVNKIALSLTKTGASVTVIGRNLGQDYQLNENFRIKRFRLLFNKKFFFYAEYNVRLFFYLLFHRTEILVANDLDTLPANYMVSIIKRNTLVYDSHEYFTEVPELEGRFFVKKIWSCIEKQILPKIKYSYTVCDSLAKIYKEKYGIDMKVIRNLPVLHKEKNTGSARIFETKTIIYQGSLNIGRGLELMIETMQYIDNAKLLIIGDGDIRRKLQKTVMTLNLTDKITFLGKIPFEKLSKYTQQAELGISLEEKTSLNYYYALPNKLFDYVHANIPVLVSDFPEMKTIIDKYDIGIATGIRNPKELSELIRDMLFNRVKREKWILNTKKAQMELCWQKEEKILFDLYTQII